MAKGIEKKADNMWSACIRQVGYCEWCGQPGDVVQLHAHHIILRGNKAYRHDLSNGVCLCASCHTMGVQSAHTDRTAFLAWLKRECKGQWIWFKEHTVEVKKLIGNKTVISYKAIKMEHRGDKVEYEELKEIFESGK